MMIDIKRLTEKDIGRWVKYTGTGEEGFGRIKTWNDIFIFVVYNCNSEWDRFKDFTPSATNPNCLEFIDEKEIVITGELPYFEIDRKTKLKGEGFLKVEVEKKIKILKIRHCEECKFNDYFYDTKTDLSRFICRHPDFKTRYRTYKIINRAIALKGEIPYWCPLEDYEIRNI